MMMVIMVKMVEDDSGNDDDDAVRQGNKDMCFTFTNQFNVFV